MAANGNGGFMIKTPFQTSSELDIRLVTTYTSQKIAVKI